jgi:hypothetical protein
VHDIVRETGERSQRMRPIEIAPYRSHTQSAQRGKTTAIARKRVDEKAPAHELHHAQRYVSAADDQQTSHIPILAEASADSFRCLNA